MSNKVPKRRSNLPEKNSNHSQQKNSNLINGDNNKISNIVNQRVGFTAMGVAAIIFVIFAAVPSLRPNITINSPQQGDDSAGNSIEAELDDLENYLKTQDLESADRATTDILMRLAGYSEEHPLTTQDFEAIPCPYLRQINQAWLRHSEGKFGFSVQYEVTEPYRSDPNLTGSERWEKTLDALFGKERDESREYLYNFDANSVPKGSFPRWQRLKEPSDTNWQLLSVVPRCGLG